MATKGKKFEIYYTSQGTTEGIDASALIFDGANLEILTHGKVFKGTDTTYSFKNLTFKNNADESIDAYKPTTAAKTLKAGTNVEMSATSSIITISATDTTYANFVGSGANAAAGLVPKPSTTAGATKFLREDGGWQVPDYTTIPSNNVTGSGTNGYIAKWSGSNTLTNGPAFGSANTFLQNNGNWATPTDTWIAADLNNAGYVPKGVNGYFLSANANGLVWVANPNTNTHRPIQLKGTQILGDNTTALNFAQGTGITLSNDGGTITITNASPDQNHNTDANVLQQDDNGNYARPVLMKYGDNSSTANVTNRVLTCDGVTINPSTNSLSVSGNLSVTGTASFGNNVTTSGTLTISPTNVSAQQVGLILHDPGGGGSEACWINWTSGSYSTGVKLMGKPDTNTLEFHDGTAWRNVIHAGNYTSYAIPQTGVGNRIWLNYNSNLSTSYSWTNSALTVPTLEVQNYTGTVDTQFPTITLHHYGYGGPRISSRQGVLYVYGGNTDARTLGSQNGYFSEMRIYPNNTRGLYVNDEQVITSGNISSQSVNYATSAGSSSSTSTLLTSNSSQSGDTCYNANPGLHFYRFNGTGNTIGGGDGWIMQWSWNQGSVGGQIYVDDNPSGIIGIRGCSGSSGTACTGFTDWWRLYSDNYHPSADYATTAGSVSWSNVSDKPNVAIRASANNLLCAGNEFNFISAGFSGGVWFNYQDENRANAANIDTYYFGNGRGGALAYIQSGYFSGTAAAANSVSWSNVTSKPSTFAPSSHSHSYSQITDGTSSSTSSGWSHILSNTYNGSQKSIFYMCHGGGYGAHLRGYSTSSSVYMLEIYNSSSQVFAVWGDGHANFAGSVYSNSDRRLKKNISRIDKGSLGQLFNISDKLLKQFTWKQSGKASYGFIAQELEKYIPEAVSVNTTTKVKSVSYDIAYAKIIASLVNEIKKLKAQVKSLMDDK